MSIKRNCPLEATQLLISILRSFPPRNGRSLQSIYRESGVDVSKYKPGGSTPQVFSLFKFGYSLGIEPAWLLVLSSKTCQGDIDNEQLEKIIGKLPDYATAMDTAFVMVAKELTE